VQRDGSGPGNLSDEERERLAAYRSAASLAELRELTGAADEHQAYFAAKAEWRALRERELEPPSVAAGLPGTRVEIDGRPFFVHGITHQDTDAERAYLREHVERFLAADEAVYCEQGIRSMYFDDLPDVCQTDDYRWAMRECERLDVEPRVDPAEFDGLLEDVDGLTGRFRKGVFALIDDGQSVYGDRFERALGDVATYFLTTHEDAARGSGYESFSLSRRAAADPSRLPAIQRYYETVFLPQPIEREWLRRHDPELAVFSHARNERLADYVVAHADDAPAVHLIVGAAHQPGVQYYLEAHRDGNRSVEGFEPE
jgi:hypothetical protein